MTREGLVKRLKRLESAEVNDVEYRLYWHDEAPPGEPGFNCDGWRIWLDEARPSGEAPRRSEARLPIPEDEEKRMISMH